jgi:NAD(P)-dependent dehydrogenase (short-subunit alcohol dehydrogenase family)
MNLNLDGKTALVTGSTRGIGRAIAEKLLDCGAAVGISGRGAEGVERTLAEMKARGRTKVAGRAADVKVKPEVESLFLHVERELGGIDILVNNAGVGMFATLEQLEPEQWAEVIGTNLTGVYHCIHEALPRMKARGGGWIVNISSLAGKNPFAGGAAYNASKFGLNGMSEAVMLDHRYEGVRVASILPGSVSTGFGSGRAADWKIQPEDIAETVAFIIGMPERTLISHVEIRPAKPKR